MSPIDTAPIDAAAARSELIAHALAKATAAHAGQIRNGSGGLPYIEHPRMVAAALAARGYGETTLAAALLHDVVEDSDTTVEDLRAELPLKRIWALVCLELWARQHIDGHAHMPNTQCA